MTILITGASGYTGGKLAVELCKRGHHVRALVRPGRDVSDLEAIGVDIVRGDIRDQVRVIEAARGCETIYHLAAVFRTAGHSSRYYHEVNIGGAVNVVEAVRRHGVGRLVHCSTVGVHGDIEPRYIPADESAPLCPGDVYQRSKLEGELLVQEQIADGLPAVVFRPGGIYGPGDLRFLKLFRSIHNSTFRMFGSGRVLYHLTYIDDLIDGIIRCGEKREALGRTYILVGPRYTSLNELAAEIAHAVGVPEQNGKRRGLPASALICAAIVCEAVCVPLGIDPPLHRRRVHFFCKNRAFSIKKAVNELGYMPMVDLREGLLRTAEWYFDHGWLHRHVDANFALMRKEGA